MAMPWEQGNLSPFVKYLQQNGMVPEMGESFHLPQLRGVSFFDHRTVLKMSHFNKLCTLLVRL